MLKVNKSDIGKKVICGIYLDEKRYGVIVSYTADKITVKAEPYGKLIEYNYEDVDMDFQPGDGFQTDMEYQWAIFTGKKMTSEDLEVKEVVEIVEEVEVEEVETRDVEVVQKGAETKSASVISTITVKDGI